MGGESSKFKPVRNARTCKHNSTSKKSENDGKIRYHLNRLFREADICSNLPIYIAIFEALLVFRTKIHDFIFYVHGREKKNVMTLRTKEAVKKIFNDTINFNDDISFMHTLSTRVSVDSKGLGQKNLGPFYKVLYHMLVGNRTNVSFNGENGTYKALQLLWEMFADTGFKNRMYDLSVPQTRRSPNMRHLDNILYLLNIIFLHIPVGKSELIKIRLERFKKHERDRC
jgi:hypothetical protein